MGAKEGAIPMALHQLNVPDPFDLHLFLGGLVANTLLCVAPGGYRLLTLIEEYLAFGENIAMPGGNCRSGNRVIAQAFPERFHQLNFSEIGILARSV